MIQIANFPWSRLLAVFAAATWSCLAGAGENLQTGGPYVPTPQVVVDQMLRVANVGEKDFVIDLGSGDGVIVLTAARQHRASGMGIEIDADLVKLSNESARRLGVADRVHFRQLDVFKANVSQASVVTLYLLPAMMIDLRPKIFHELRPGVRVVSHDYHFGEWAPDDQVTFDVPEKEKINGVPQATIYLWHVPAKIAGKWALKVAGGETYELTLKQRFQKLEGSVTAGGKSLAARRFTLRGNDFGFSLPEGKGVARFSGRVKDNTAIEGVVESPGAKTLARWSAVLTATARVITE